jgi:hypothetical protein
LSNHCQDLHCSFSEICTEFVTVPLSDPSWNHTRPDTLLQIKGRKKLEPSPSCTKFCKRTPKIC